MIKVLIADPDPSYAAMIQQVLQETKRFEASAVSTGAEAISLATKLQPDIVLLESSLEDFSLRDAVTVLRRSQPNLPIVVVLPFGGQALPDAAKYFDVQGILSKPLYIPELQNEIDVALTKPVNGVTPPPRKAETATSAQANVEAKPTPSQAAKPKAPQPPAWLNDVSRAAQYLTTLTLESSAEAAMLMRDHELIAFAGQPSKEEAEELARLVAASWAKDGGASASGALVRFIRMASGSDYLVYSSLVAEEVVLSMAFQAETPLGQIRKQAKRATTALFTEPKPEPEPALTEAVSEPTPVAEAAPPTEEIPAVEAAPIAPHPTDEPVEATPPFTNLSTFPEELLLSPTTAPSQPLDEVVEPPTASQTEESTAAASDEIDWRSFPVKEPTHIPPFDWLPLSQQTSTGSNGSNGNETTEGALLFMPEPQANETDLELEEEDASPLLFTPSESDFQSIAEDTPEEQIEVAETEVEPLPDAESLNQLSNAILQLERQALVEQPPLLELPPTALPAVRRTPHALYDLTYTFLIIPRLPTNMLHGDLKARLEQWLITLADAYDWEADTILIEPSHIELHVRAAPGDSPDYIAKTLQAETSDRILAEFPRLAADHAKRPGAFWSPGYFVTTPGRPLSLDEIGAFIEYQRREQSGGKY